MSRLVWRYPSELRPGDRIMSRKHPGSLKEGGSVEALMHGGIRTIDTIVRRVDGGYEVRLVDGAVLKPSPDDMVEVVT